MPSIYLYHNTGLSEVDTPCNGKALQYMGASIPSPDDVLDLSQFRTIAGDEIAIGESPLCSTCRMPIGIYVGDMAEE